MIELERCHIGHFKNHPNDRQFGNEYFWQDKPIIAWVKEEKDIEEGALKQLLDVASLPFVYKHVAAMPDVHQGYGITIGGVVACYGVLVPYFVGFDKGCGMRFVKTNIKAEDLTKDMIIQIRRLIKKVIPVGDGKAHKEMQEWDGFDEYMNDLMFPPKWWKPDKWRWIKKSLGSLGGGNHFIEIQITDDGYVALMIHSGSRNLGKLVCEHHHKIAKAMCDKYYARIPNTDCAFLPSDSLEGGDYLNDMTFCLDYAKENRKRMMQDVQEVFAEVIMSSNGDIPEYEPDIDVHHNYASLENHMGKNVWVHRKGAISAKEGETGIIPGSQGSPSYIVKGLGNRIAFMSAPHGAGRRMGRNVACKTLDLEEETRRMDGVVFDSFGINNIKGTDYPDLQEADGAYKDINEVIDNAADLVEVVAMLKPVGSVKGHDRRVKNDRNNTADTES